MPAFDPYRDTYEDAVNDAIGFSGADVDFFAKVKADDLLAMLRRHAGDPADARVLDVGCGPGVTDRFLGPVVGELHGVDVSPALLETAAAANPDVRYHAYGGGELPFESGNFDLTFAICVLHHVVPAARLRFVGEMARVTRPGGLVAIYEHNPFNPLTRVVVARCAFDKGVVLLRTGETKRLLSAAAAPPLESRHIVFFPWERRFWRSVEARLGWLPLGGQYVVAGRRPPGSEQ